MAIMTVVLTPDSTERTKLWLVELMQIYYVSGIFYFTYLISANVSPNVRKNRLAQPLIKGGYQKEF